MATNVLPKRPADALEKKIHTIPTCIIIKVLIITLEHIVTPGLGLGPPLALGAPRCRIFILCGRGKHNSMTQQVSVQSLCVI